MATTPVNTKLDFGNANRIINLAAATANGQPVIYEQLNAVYTYIQGLSSKDDVVVAVSTNVTLATPGATLDGITMVSGDRVLLFGQTTVSENGIYIWSGASSALVRASDSDTFNKLESALVFVNEGTYAGYGFKQTQVNGVIDTNDLIWVDLGTIIPLATETVAGKLKLATQAETNTGTNDTNAVTPLKLANYTGFGRRYSTTIGNGSSLSYTVTHSLNTEDVIVYVREASGSKREIFVEKDITGVNTVAVVFDSAPASNSIRVTVMG